MNTYLIELSLYWLAFWGLYALLLRQEKFFRLNRLYLLGTFVLGLVLPLIKWSTLWAAPEWLGMPVVWLQTVTVAPENANIVSAAPAANWSWMSFFWRVYLLGTLFAAIRFLFGLTKLFQYYRTGRKRWEDGICWIENEQAHAPFSWLHFLFWSNQANTTEAERAAIVAHEKAHIQQKHSWDILLLEVVGIFCWWHPLWYAYRHELENIHEYLADATVLQATPTREYGKLLLRQCLQQPDLPLVQTFHTSQLKKRIIMMTKSPSSTLALGKYLLFLPLTLMLLMACEDAEAQEEMDKVVNDLSDEAKFFERVDTVITFDPATLTEDVAIVKTKIYEKADQMPIFGNCEGYTGQELEDCSGKNLLTFIYENVKYPKEAFEAKQEGLALTKFVVDTQGRVTDIQLITEKTTEHTALNEAALATLRQLPDFTPGQHNGKPVSVQMVMPIKFKLN
ncbi:M56 family metallopeptidase [Lewinella cohaerens]|uniref:M56 family metallopeptidase n=1 Tax=Lewinella cohaerens TaxID=70995 RepID=UPI00035E7B8B|nr:M56 family metallopeptidase [Lewinella cohaerens]